MSDLVAHDLVFHRDIAEAAGNAYLASLLDSLSRSTLRARIWRGITQEYAVDRTLTEHRVIVDAMASGDAALVWALTVVHVSGVVAWLRSAPRCRPAENGGSGADYRRFLFRFPWSPTRRGRP